MTAYHRYSVGVFSLLLAFLPMCSIHCEPTPDAHSGTPASEKQLAPAAGEKGSEQSELIGKQPLTEEMVVEMCRKAFEERGYDESALEPFEYRSDFPKEQKERLFQRFKKGDYPDVGRMMWRYKDIRRGYFMVRILPNGSEYRCEIYRQK
jgi:hypothetical protein